MGGGAGSTTLVVVVDGDRQVAVCQLVVPHSPDLELVDVLALLQVAVRRRGWSIRVPDPCPRLRELLELTGLAPLLCGAPPLPVEAGREPEGGEQLGVEEVVEPGDPAV